MYPAHDQWMDGLVVTLALILLAQDYWRPWLVRLLTIFVFCVVYPLWRWYGLAARHIRTRLGTALYERRRRRVTKKLGDQSLP